MRIPMIVCTLLLTYACAFSIKVPQIPTAKTELERQILGTYEEIDDEVVLISTVRAKDAKGKLDLNAQVNYARQNQKFNLDDIEELKNAQILGEKADGTLGLVPSQHKQKSTQPESLLRLARLLIQEENNDRSVIWQEIISRQVNLSKDSLHEVRTTYAKLKRKESKPGQWYQTSNGEWVQKIDETTDIP